MKINFDKYIFSFIKLFDTYWVYQRVPLARLDNFGEKMNQSVRSCYVGEGSWLNFRSIYKWGLGGGSK